MLIYINQIFSPVPPVLLVEQLPVPLRSLMEVFGGGSLLAEPRHGHDPVYQGFGMPTDPEQSPGPQCLIQSIPSSLEDADEMLHQDWHSRLRSSRCARRPSPRNGHTR